MLLRMIKLKFSLCLTLVELSWSVEYEKTTTLYMLFNLSGLINQSK